MPIPAKSNKPRSRRTPRPRRGTACIEFALVAPVFFLTIFGLIESGRMMMLKHALTDAAREGCRAAGLASSINADDIETVVRNHLTSSLGNTAYDLSKVRVIVPTDLTSVSSETDMMVAVEVDYADASWLPISFLGTNPIISSEARRKRE